jgi:hypothetical protein
MAVIGQDEQIGSKEESELQRLELCKEWIDKLDKQGPSVNLVPTAPTHSRSK